MLVPYRLNTLMFQRPWMNWLLIVLMVAFAFIPETEISDAVVEAMVLKDWSASGLLGHVFLHAGLSHLIGNMVILLVFGNAVCGNTSNVGYLVLFFVFAVAAGGMHLLLDGRPAVGASGAIYGVVGMTLAMYPLNRVSVFWWFLAMGTFRVAVWKLAVIWAIFDTIGAIGQKGPVAHVAHLGGLLMGVAVGWLLLRMRWVELSEVDHRSLEEIFAGKTEEDRKAWFRAQAAAERAAQGAGPVAGESWLGEGARVMPATPEVLRRWWTLASEAQVSPEDRAVLLAGGRAADRRRFELRYGETFGALGYSFSHSLADYLHRVAKEQIHPHEETSLAYLLRLFDAELPAMLACGFVEPGVASLRDDIRMRVFLGGANQR